MAIPDYQDCMLPLLKVAFDQKEHTIKEAIECLSDKFNLSESDRSLMLPSGQQRVIANRIGWASTYLKKSNLIETTSRGSFKITERGLSVIKDSPERIDNNFLRQFSEFDDFVSPKSNRKTIDSSKGPKFESVSTPEEIIEKNYETLNQDLSEQIIATVKSSSPSFFEMLVVDLLLKMGYGGSRKEAGKIVGKSGDEGIDGIISEDKLGLDTIYLQAKKWEGVIGRPEIQKFVGALQGQRAKKGIFITTSRFTSEAVDFITKIDTKVVLIDGERLSELMIEYEVGVSKIAEYEIKKIDSDYFDK